MSKKMKLNLDELKVQSFFMELNKDVQLRINGGVEPTDAQSVAAGPACGHGPQGTDPRN